MSDFRVFCTPPSPEPTQITLSPEESHHLVIVNRARAGAPVVAFDGQGTEWQTTLTGDRKNAAVLTVQTRRQIPRLPYAITLGQALPKGAAMDAIVRKATEIGVARIVPLESERTQVHLSGDRSDRKADKWKVAALEAAKQCGNPFLPEVLAPQNAIAFMRQSDAFDLKLIASLQPGATSLKPVLTAFQAQHGGEMPKRVLWLIGPEGDFSPSEMALSRELGFAPITLGPLVLRSETAAVYAVSILSYELQNG
jgi:16S rRNA (uracil1498-N3)-methyltransferase